jgi:hypothetical protein
MENIDDPLTFAFKLRTANISFRFRHNGCCQKIGDLPLANVDYVGNEQQPHRATTKEADHEKEYHFCRS